MIDKSTAGHRIHTKKVPKYRLKSPKKAENML